MVSDGDYARIFTLSSIEHFKFKVAHGYFSCVIDNNRLVLCPIYIVGYNLFSLILLSAVVNNHLVLILF